MVLSIGVMACSRNTLAPSGLHVRSLNEFVYVFDNLLKRHRVVALSGEVVEAAGTITGEQIELIC